MALSSKALIFKVQTDFSDAEKGLDSFASKFTQLDTLADGLGKKIQDALKGAFSYGASGVDPEKLLPARVLSQNASALQKSLEGVYGALLDMQRSLQGAAQGGAAFNQDIKSVQEMEKEVANLDAGIQAVRNTLKAPSDPQEMGAWLDKLNEAPQTIQKIAEALGQIQSKMSEVGGRSEMQFLLQFKEGLPSLTSANEEISKLTAKLGDLRQISGGLGDNVLARAFQSKDIEAFNAQTEKFGSSLEKIQAQAQKASETLAKLGPGASAQEIKKAEDQVNGLNAQLLKLSETGTKLQSFGSSIGSWGSISKVLGDMTVQSALLAAGFAGWFSVIQQGMSVVTGFISTMDDWQQKSVTLQNQTGANGRAIEQMMGSIREINSLTGTPFDQLAQGYRKTAAEGFNFADSQKIVATATEAAVAQQVDAGRVTNGLATILRDFNLKADDSQQVMGALYRASQIAGVGVDQMAEAVGKASAAEGPFRASLPEIIAGITTLAQRSGDFTSAGAAMTQVMLRMSQLSPKAAADIAAINPNFLKDFTPDAMSSVGGFTKALNDIAIAAKQNPEILKEVFGIINDGGKAIQLSNDDLKQYIQNLNDVGASGTNAGKMQADYVRQVSTLNVQFEVFKSNLKDVATLFGALPAFIGRSVESMNMFMYTMEHLGKGGIDLSKFIVSRNPQDLKQAFDELKKGATTGDYKNYEDTLVKQLAGGDKNTESRIKAAVSNNGQQAADAIAQGSVDAQAKIAQSLSTISKGMQDVMKLFAEGQSFVMPQGIDDALRTLAVAMKKVFDNFDAIFNGVSVPAAENSDKVAKAVADQIKALTDLIGLFKELPQVDISDPENKIKALVEQLRLIETYVTSALAPSSPQAGGQVGAAADVAKNVAEEVKLLTDIANLFKELPQVSIDQDMGPKIQALVAAASTIAVQVTTALSDLDKGTKSAAQVAAPLAENVSKMVTLIKDVAELYKQMPGLEVKDITPQIEQMVNTAAVIMKDVEKLGPMSAATADGLKNTAEVISKQATALKDVASVYKEMTGVDLGQPDSKITELANHAALITRAVTPLGSLDKATADNLSNEAEVIGRQATALKDVAALYKEMSGVDLGQPDTKLSELASHAATITRLVTPLGEMSKDTADGLSNEAEVVGRQATALKDVAGLYKEMTGVDLGQPDSKLEQLAAHTATITRLVTPLGEMSKETAEGLSNEAEVVGRQATALKDVAGLYKEMTGVDLGQPDSKLAQLASHAAVINRLVTPLGELDKETADGLSAMAEVIGRQATALKDVAGLYKEMSGVDFGTPDTTLQFLAEKAGAINRLVTPLGSLDKTTADGLSAMAEVIGRQATALKDVAGLYKEMEGIDFGQPDENLAFLADKSKRVYELVTPLGGLDKQTGDSLNLMAEVLGKEATALKDTAGLLKEMASVDFSQDPMPGIERLAEILEHISNVLADVLSEAPKADYSKVIDDMGKEAGALKNVAELLNVMSSMVVPQNPEAVIDRLVEIVEHISNAMGDILYESPKQDYSTVINNISGTIKAVTDTVKLLTDLQNLGSFSTSNVESRLTNVVKIMLKALEDFDAQIQAIPHDPKVEAIAADADAVMKPITDTIKAIGDIAGLPTVSDSEIRNAIDTTIRIMLASLAYFDDKLKGIQHDPLVTQVATDAGAVMKAIDDTLKVFETLGNKKHPLVFNPQAVSTAIEGAIAAVKDFMRQIAASSISDGDIAKAAKWAEDMTKIIDLIDKVSGKTTLRSSVSSKGTISSSISSSGGGLGGGLSQIDLSALVNKALAGSGAPQGAFVNVPGGIGFLTPPRPFVPPTPPPPSNVVAGQSNVPTIHQSSEGTSPAGSSGQEKNTINVDIVMDGQLLARSLNNETFKGQNLRANIVPTPLSPI